METTHLPLRAGLSAFACAICLCFITTIAVSQAPVVTVRLANPVYDCLAETYCLDVEFLADEPDLQVFGMNVRFFYPDATLELIGFTDFQGGYGPVSPNPPMISTNAMAGPALFNFVGAADFVNGAIQLVDPAGAITLDTMDWTKLFQICFTIDDPAVDSTSFCPPIVWDLEQNPANGGFLVGDDGVVITVVDPDPNVESTPVIENVVQFNWVYSGPGTPPYGMPVEIECISLLCIPVITCPEDVTIDCTETIHPSNTGFATATDDCPGEIIISFSDSIIAGLCPQNFTIARTWIATHVCEIADTCVQFITVIDTTGPTFNPACQPLLDFFTSTGSDCPAASIPSLIVGQIISESETWTVDGNIIPGFDGCLSDNCADADSLTARVDSISITGDNCDRFIFVFFTILDPCGNESTTQLIATIRIHDDTPPVIECPADITIECDELTSPDNTGVATAVDSCQTAVVITSTDSIIPGTCPQELTIIRTWTADDNCGNTSTCSQTILVQDNTAPFISCPADLTLECTDTIPTDLATASDNCSDTIIYAFTDIVCDNPVMGFNGVYDFTNWSIILSPQGGSVTPVGDSEVMLVSPDGLACSGASTLFQIIIPASGQLVFDWDYSTSDIDGPGFDPFGYNLNGIFTQLTDSNGADVQSGTTRVAVTAGDVFAFRQNSNDCVLGSGATTVVEFFACIDQVGDICTQLVIRTHTALDECGNSASCVQTIVIEDTTPPVITCPASITIDCGDSILPGNTGFATATDDCQDVGITYTDLVVTASCPFTNLILRTWVADDSCGNTSMCVQTIGLIDTIAPLITCPADTLIDCTTATDTAALGAAFAIDACDTALQITFINDTVPGACPQAFTITRTWTVLDDCLNSTTCVQTITVQDTTPPTFDPACQLVFEFFTSLGSACPATSDISLVEGQIVGEAEGWIAGGNAIPSLNGCLFDNCTDPDSLTARVDSIAIAGDTCDRTITIFFTILDQCGNESVSQFVCVVIIHDDVAPEISCPDDITIECDELTDPTNTGTATATDDCQTGVIISSSDVIIPGGCINEMIIQRTWTADDGCGNVDTCLQTIAIQDNTPPLIDCPDDLTLECTDSIPTDLATATDNCSGVIDFDFTDILCDNPVTGFTGPYDFSNWTIVIPPQGGSVTPMGDTEVMLVSPDGLSCSGASALFSVVIPSSGQLVFDWSYFTNDISGPGFDPFGYNLNGTFFQLTQDNGSDNQSGTATVIVTAGDVFAFEQNSTDCIFGAGATTVVEFFACTEEAGTLCTQLIIRTHTATDVCGNTASCLQTIYLEDNTPPVIVCPEDVTIECNESTLPANTGTATGSDLCSDSLGIAYMDFVCANPVQGFTGVYSFSNWTIVVPPQGGSVTPMGDTEVMLVSPNEIGCTGASTMLSIVIPSTGQVIFDWHYSTNDLDGPSFDPFGYILNGTFVQLSSNIGGDVQSGTTTLAVTAGDQFSFTQNSTDCILGAGATTVVEFFACIAQDSVPCSQLVIRTHIATDGCGNSASCLQTIFIEDSTPPLIVCPPNVTVSLPDDTSPGNTGSATATDNCTLLPELLYDDVTIDDPCDSSYTIQRTWIATDECNNSSTCLQVIEVTDPDTLEEEVLAIACLDALNLSIDNECGTIVVSGMLLTGDQAGNDSYTVIIIDQNGDTVPNATFTFEHVGQTFMVMVLNECTGQSCWTIVTVEDKLPPQLNCTCPTGNELDSCEISCLEIDEFLAGNIPVDLQPTAVDNCGGTTIEIVNIELSYETCADGYIRVTWLATDAGDNTSTCVQQFNIVPLTLETLDFPADYFGDCDDSSDPSVTGWPQVDGIDLSNVPSHCNILATYTDNKLDLCGGGLKIIRTWKVFDWCVPEIQEFTQFIILGDQEGPVLTCPQDMIVGTEVWYCYANVTVPKPLAIDACSAIKSYHLFSPEGTVVAVGNNFKVNGLPEGTYTLTWTVYDECHNSSSCSFDVTVIDNVPPVPACKQHLIVSLTNDRPNGITLVPADAFDDGSQDNCTDVQFRARRMDSCIDFNWTTGGACVDDIPGGIPAVNSFDLGTAHGICVPFSCCDIGAGPIMIELEVRDGAGNINYCMIEVEVQDKLAPVVTCPPHITVSCEFPFNVEPGLYVDNTGNNDGSLDEDPLSELFGNMYDAFRYTPAARQNIIINDPDNELFAQPHNFGIEGWATDNCEVNLQVSVQVYEDCSGEGLPGDAPPGAVKLITRLFSARDATGNTGGSCMQRIWVVDFDPFYISDETCFNADPLDGVIWPCDVLVSDCPEEIMGTGQPIILDDGCSIVGVTFKDAYYDVADSVCFKILREWSIIDWCQFDANTGEGIWTYTQTIRVADSAAPVFLHCPQAPVELCLDNPGISLPANNQAFLGENNPNASSCSVHVALSQAVREMCSGFVNYDVKIYPFNGNEFIQIKPTTVLELGPNHEGLMTFDTEESSIPSIALEGLPYNSPQCGDYHRILWSVEDGCGNKSFCEYLFRLEDCKDPSPVCINGLSTVVMGSNGEVTIWASDFDASSFDDCTPSESLLFSFSGTSYQPSFTYTCDNVPEFGEELAEEIWVADAGVDQNCNGQIEWSERNKDFCVTFIVITDNNGVCEETGLVLSGEIMTEYTDAVGKVMVNLTSPGNSFPGVETAADGKFTFGSLISGYDYTIRPERNDDHGNGVSTLDLVRIQKHLLGKEVFTSPYQYIAADANKSNSVSAIDLIEIRKLILGLYDKFPVNQSWRFVREDAGMVPGNPWPFAEEIEIYNLNDQTELNLDFVGVKVGDVNNTVKANALQILPRNARRMLTVKGVSKDVLSAGEILEVRMVIPEMTSGFQWTLETNGLEYAGIESTDIPIDDSNVGLLSNGMVTMSWHGEPRKTNDGQQISFTMKFKVNEPGALEDLIRMSGKITQAEAYTPEGEILDVQLSFDNDLPFTDFALYQNRPNPWQGQTLIGFDLPYDAPAILTVYDVTGMVVKTVTGDYKAGYNSIMLTTKDIPMPGMLYYRLESGSYSATKKMMTLH